MILEVEGYAHLPRVAVDSDKKRWVVWVLSKERASCIFSQFLTEQGDWSERFLVSHPGKVASLPEIKPFSKGVLIGWLELSSRETEFWLREFNGETWLKPLKVPLLRGIYRNLSILPLDDSKVWIAYEQHFGFSSKIFMACLLGDSFLIPPFEVSSKYQGMQLRPQLACSSQGEIFCVWEYHKSGLSGIICSIIGRGEDMVHIPVTNEPGMHFAPSIASDREGNLFIAWHHSRGRDRDVDIPRWIELRMLLRDGSLGLFPEMKDRDLEKKGEDQSLEFAEVLVLQPGLLVIFARGSHCFYYQLFTSRGWSSLMPLGPVKWGARGKKVSAFAFSDNEIWTARKESEGIVIETFRVKEREGKIVPKDIYSPVELRPYFVPRLNQREIKERFEGIFFGDLHVHSVYSDGLGCEEEVYLRAREIYRDDFVAITDHESFLGKRIDPGLWWSLNEVAERFNRDERFVTLIGYEWTGQAYPQGPGHVCVYLPHPLPIKGRGEGRNADLRELYEWLEKNQGFAIPHHIGWTGIDLDLVGRVTSVCEICSVHGVYEERDFFLIPPRSCEAGFFVREILDQGVRFGFVGGSDGHGLIWHHGISRIRDPFRTGLTAVLCKSLTRENILKALKKRQCYATSGAKIGLDFRVNNMPMGSIIPLRLPLEFYVHILGTYEIHEIRIRAQKRDIFIYDGQGKREIELDFSLKELASSWDYFYLRVIQKDGEMAWSSPIWVEA
jgi:hypothetical protein